MEKIRSATMIIMLILAMMTEMPAHPVKAKSFTYIDHDIVQDTVWTPEASPYIIVRSIAINATVRILPGTEVRIADDIEIRIYGALEALGEPERPVILKGQGTRETYFINIYNGEVRLSNVIMSCSFTYDWISNSRIVIENSTIKAFVGRSLLSEVVNSNIALDNVSVEGELNLECSRGSSVTLNNVVLGRLDIVLEKSNAVLSHVAVLGKSSILLDEGSILRAREFLARGLDLFVWGKSIATIEKSIIAFGEEMAVDFQFGGGNVTIRDSAIHHLEGVYVSGEGYICAKNNWWGDSSGPCSEALNPSGNGVKVYADPDVMTFIPWLEEAPDFMNSPLSIQVLEPEVERYEEEVTILFRVRLLFERQVSSLYKSFISVLLTGNLTAVMERGVLSGPIASVLEELGLYSPLRLRYDPAKDYYEVLLKLKSETRKGKVLYYELKWAIIAHDLVGRAYSSGQVSKLVIEMRLSSATSELKGEITSESRTSREEAEIPTSTSMNISNTITVIIVIIALTIAFLELLRIIKRLAQRRP